RVALLRGTARPPDQAPRASPRARGDRGPPPRRRGRHRRGGRGGRARRRTRSSRGVRRRSLRRRCRPDGPRPRDARGIAPRLRAPAPRPARRGAARHRAREARSPRAPRARGVTPYVGLTYFLLLLYPLLALVAVGVLGRLGRSIVLLVSVAIVVVQYGEPPIGDPSTGLGQLAYLGAYAVGSVVVVCAYGAAPRRQRAFYLAVALALLPVVLAKVHAAAREWAPTPEPHRYDAPGLATAAPGLFDTFGFLGMSYIALRVLDVVIALHDGVLRETPRTADLLSYLLFVPTISAGPIDRFRRYTHDLDGLPRPRRDYLRDVEAGIHRIAQGLLYKFIIAYLIYRHALRPLGG